MVKFCKWYVWGGLVDWPPCVVYDDFKVEVGKTKKTNHRNPTNPGSPKLRMVSWNLNTSARGTDCTTASSSSDKGIGSLGNGKKHQF